MIIFKISTGELFLDSENASAGPQSLIGHAYAGHPPHVNDASATNLHAQGPLPVGLYTIGAPEDHPESVGAFALPLTPDPINTMFGRSGFFCHGDNPLGNQTASDGCIVTARQVRELIAQNALLQVVA